MSFLSKVETGVKKKPAAMLWYSMPGLGKTSIAAHFPNVLFLTDVREDGINDLKQHGQVPADVAVAPAFDSWEDFLAILDELAETDHSFKYVCIDSLTGFERLCHRYVTDVKYKGEPGDDGFLSYNQGFETSIPFFEEAVDKLEALRHKGIGVIILAHSKVKPFNDPLAAAPYDKVLIDVHPKTASVFEKWATDIGYIELTVSVEQKKNAKVGDKGKAKASSFRRMRVTPCAVAHAKNRAGIKLPIALGSSPAEGFKAICEAYKPKATA